MATEQEESVKLLDPTDDIKPHVSKEIVPDLVARLYGLKVTSMKQLPSYDDLNFFITVEERFENRNLSGICQDGYVFKILNSLQSSQPTLIQAQHALKKHVRQHGIPTQVPILNKNGDDYSVEKFQLPDGKEMEYIVRLVTYVPGRTYVNTPYVPGTFINVGKFLGRFHKALEGFHHQFYETYNSVWSLAEVPQLRNFLHAVKDDNDASVVKQVLDCFEKEIVPLFDKFKKGTIHGDVNEQNLVMKELPNQDDTPTHLRVHDVACILDFFDSMLTYPVFDVAICIMYTSLDAPKDIQLDVGGYILSGYQQFASLNDAEFDSLVGLVCARLCQSLVYGAHGYMLDPSNTYLLTTAKRGWEFLHRLWNLPKDELKLKWKGMMMANQQAENRQRN